MKEYLVPRDVQSRMEIFPGFGFVELGVTLIGAVVGFILQVIPWVLPIAPGPQFVSRLFCFTIPTTIAYMLVKQDFGGGNMLKQITAWRQWSGNRKVIYYRKRGCM